MFSLFFLSFLEVVTWLQCTTSDLALVHVTPPCISRHVVPCTPELQIMAGIMEPCKFIMQIYDSPPPSSTLPCLERVLPWNLSRSLVLRDLALREGCSCPPGGRGQDAVAFLGTAQPARFSTLLRRPDIFGVRLPITRPTPT